MFSRLRELIDAEYSDNHALKTFVNDIVDDDNESDNGSDDPPGNGPDFEQIITFFEQSPSALHRALAANAREHFRTVLTDTFDEVDSEQDATPDDLYYGLLDFHSVSGGAESLNGFLTLNYDDYLEHAITRSPLHSLDPGIHIDSDSSTAEPVRVVKLHGSFGWTRGWPMSHGGNQADTVWIPPGIQKTKERYPFNLLWGLAREMLDCDVLRVIGCNLSGNDWDLISLLFTTRHADRPGGAYRVEVIDSPTQALRLQAQFPYLDIKSILEIDALGPPLMSAFGHDDDSPFEDLSPENQQEVAESIPWDNWFLLWLKHKVEDLYIELGDVGTELGFVDRLLRGHA